MTHDLSNLDLATRLRLTVSTPPVGADDPTGSSQLETLAAELLQSPDYTVYLPALLQDDQQFGHAFGAKLATLVSDQEQLLQTLLAAFSNIPGYAQNPILISGVLSQVTAVLKTTILQHFTNDPALTQHAFYMITTAGPTEADINLLFPLIDKKELDITILEGLQHNNILQQIAPEALLRLAERTAVYDTVGKMTALQLTVHYALQNEVNWEACRHFLRVFLLQNNCFLYHYPPHLADVQNLAYVIEKLLSLHGRDEELAAAVFQQVQAAIKEKDYATMGIRLRLLYSYMMLEYFDVFWNAGKISNPNNN